MSTCSAASCAPSRSRPSAPPWRRAASPRRCWRTPSNANNRNDGAGRVRDGEEALLVRAEGRIHTLDDVRTIVVAARGTTASCASATSPMCAIGALPRNGVVTAQRRGRGGLGPRARPARRQCAHRRRAASRRSSRNSSRSCPKGTEIVDLLRPQRPDRQGGLDGAEGAARGDRPGRHPAGAVPRQSARGAGRLAHPAAGGAGRPSASCALSGFSANIMSLGGLAIAIGLLVDCAVVVVENVEHRLAHAGKHRPSRRACA